MGYFRIKCHGCGETWAVDPNEVHEDHRRVCPRCEKEIDRQTWRKVIIPALGTMEDASRELEKDYTGYPGAGLFSLSYFRGPMPELTPPMDAALIEFQRMAEEATSEMEKSLAEN